MDKKQAEKRTLEDHKKERKFMFQFINHENGQRSEPLVGNWDAVREVLDLRKEGERPTDEDFILLVAVLDGKETIVPATPLITVETFRKFKEESA